MKRILSLIVAFVIVLTIIPSSVFSVGASGVSLDQLQNKYPHGKYWNGNNADSYTSQPCNHHGSCSYTGSCGCNTFKGYAIQCMGFAYQLAHLIYGGDPYAEWTPNRSTTALDSLKAGDVVRYKNDNHSIFITNVSGETVTYADCNSDGHCIIRWNQTISKSTIKSTFTYVDAAPYAWQVGEHTHSYSGSNFESVHPHRIYQKCSCGQTRYTGETTAYASCSTCMKVSIAYVQPVKAYTIKTGKTTVYSTVNGTEKTNKIYDTDLCTINAIYDCGWCKVTFPLDAGGTDTGYVKIDVFMKSGGFITYASKQLETFSRSDLKTSVGYAAEKDKIYILGNTTSAVQIAYPLTAGGYKVGWVPISSISATIKYNANGGSGTMASKTVQYQKAFTLSDNVFTKTGYSFKGWNCYRSSDKTWYTNDKGWKTESEITENGYEKKVYSNGFSGTISKVWLNLGKTSETLTFYPIWEANSLSVYFNANGGSISSDTYELKNQLVYKKGEENKYAQKWTYNNTKTNGLTNYTTFGMSKTGHKFKGWGTTAQGEIIFSQSDSSLLPTDINANIKTGNCSQTLYAIWEPNTYEVVYDANGGAGAPAKQSKIYGKELTLSGTKPIRSGYMFKGWATSLNSSTVNYQSGDTFSSNANTTLYAVWEQVIVETILIKQLPTKVQYLVGEEFNAEGLQLTLTYNDGSTEIVTSGFTILGFDSETVGTKTITVSYAEKSTNFTVEVKKPDYTPFNFEIEHNAGNMLLSNAWVKRFHKNLSGRYAYHTTTGGKIQFSFEGTQFGIVSYLSPSQGKVYVSIDGGEEFLAADLYSDVADTYFKETVYTSDELALGTHTVTVRVEGKAYMDAINITGDIVKCEAPIKDDVTIEIDNILDAEYTGTWTKKYAWKHSGHNAMYSTNGGTVTFDFEGDELSVLSYKASTQGKLYVSIDGGAEVEVSLYDESSDTLYATNVFSTKLDTYGTHTVTIRTLGKAYVDAVVIRRNSAETVTYEGEGTELTLEGDWSNKYSWKHSNHNAMFTSTGGTASFTYTGYDFRILSYKAKTQGKMYVSIDGGEAIEVDLYHNSTDTKYKEQVFEAAGLNYGTHTVTITTSGKVYLDAVKIDGALN